MKMHKTLESAFVQQYFLNELNGRPCPRFCASAASWYCVKVMQWIDLGSWKVAPRLALKMVRFVTKRP